MPFERSLPAATWCAFEESWVLEPRNSKGGWKQLQEKFGEESLRLQAEGLVRTWPDGSWLGAGGVRGVWDPSTEGPHFHLCFADKETESENGRATSAQKACQEA